MRCYAWEHIYSKKIKYLVKDEQKFILKRDKGKCETCLYKETCKNEGNVPEVVK